MNAPRENAGAVPQFRVPCMPPSPYVIPPVETSAVLDEEVWRAWVHKNHLREQATFRRLKIAAGIVLAPVAAGCVFVVFFVVFVVFFGK